MQFCRWVLGTSFAYLEANIGPMALFVLLQLQHCSSLSTVVPAGAVTPLLSTLPPLLRRWQIIGVVVAATEDEARRAAKAVVVEYEDLPAIMSCEEAIAAGSFRPYHGASVCELGRACVFVNSSRFGHRTRCI